MTYDRPSERRMDQPWEHPDWYDLHDTAWSAGSEREPEHYRELMLALPPLDRDDHLIHFRDRVALRARRSRC